MPMKCPICKKSVPDPEDKDHPNPHFPFCCDRCKLIDLGRWLDGKYQIVVTREEVNQYPGDSGASAESEINRP